MGQREHRRSGRVAWCAGEAAGLQRLEPRQLMDAELGGVRFEFNDQGEAEISFWTGEHDVDNDGSVADPTRFILTLDELRRAGQNDFSGIEEVGWDEFIHFPNGRLGILYPTGGTDYPFQVGAAFNAEDSRDLGWAIERNSGGAGVMSLLHEMPADVEMSELIGHWNFVTLVLPTDGGPTSTEVMGAYGSVDITDASGNFTYQYQTIDDSGEGSGVIQELASYGFGIVQTSEYFAVSEGKNAITAADLSFGDGRTYITVAVRRGEAMASTEVVGQYRFGSVVTGEAAARRGGEEVVFESVYLDLKQDGTLIAYDLEDFDLGTKTVLHTGRWTLLPEGRTVSVQYDGSGESHFYAFGADKNSLIDLRIGHEDGNSYTLAVGERVVSETGGGGGGGGGGDDDDDFGEDDDGSDDELITDPPLPRFIVSGRAPTGRQAVWEFGRDREWYYSKLALRHDVPDMIGELEVWQDDSGSFAAAASGSGMLLFTRSEEGPYVKRNLTTEIGEGADAPAVGVTMLALADGREILLSLNDKGDVIAYIPNAFGGTWSFLNISESEIRKEDKTVPALTGRLAAGVTKWETAIIAGLDEEGKVWSVWFSSQDADAGWQASPLSKIAKAGPMVGTLSVYLTDWNGINVAGLTETGETKVIWWVPSFKGDWEVTNLTEKFDGPTFKQNTMTTYVTPWNALTVIGITSTSRMVAYWWTPSSNTWTVSDFSEFLPPLHPRVVQGPIEVAIRPNNDIWIFGRGSQDDMIRVFWSKEHDRWTSKSLVEGAQQF